jgi:head-tail adaptor
LGLAVKISQLRHVVYVQTPTVTTSARGAETLTWADSPALRAKVRTISGDERNRNEQVTAVAAHEVTLRWPLPTGTTLTTKSRVKWTQDGVTRYFGVTFVGEPDNLRRVVVLSCEELVGVDRGL